MDDRHETLRRPTASPDESDLAARLEALQEQLRDLSDQLAEVNCSANHHVAVSPCRITVKGLMARYNISERTAVRWRKRLRDAGLLTGASPKAHSMIGQWSQIDQAVLLGTVKPSQ